jgi:AcrR family transcriptional regulator
MATMQDSNAPRRGRGRPQLRPDCDTTALIVAAAHEEFSSHGYAAANMCEVAKRAGVSVKTLYRLIPTKEELFRQAVSERIGRFALALDPYELDALPLAEALEQILTGYGALTLSADAVGIHRLVMGEGPRFPEIAASFYREAIQSTGQVFAGWLRRQIARGRLRPVDPDLAAGMLRGMMTMEPQRAAILGQRPALTDAAIAARAKACAALFLDGCRADLDQTDE